MHDFSSKLTFVITFFRENEANKANFIPCVTYSGIEKLTDVHTGLNIETVIKM